MTPRIPHSDPRWQNVFNAIVRWDAQINDIRRDDFTDEIVDLLVSDPRIAQIEALTPIYVDAWDHEAYDADAIRAILRSTP